jgi:hypothetical protein
MRLGPGTSLGLKPRSLEGPGDVWAARVPAVKTARMVIITYIILRFIAAPLEKIRHGLPVKSTTYHYYSNNYTKFWKYIIIFLEKTENNFLLGTVFAYNK